MKEIVTKIRNHKAHIRLQPWEGYNYDIEWSRLDSYEKLVGWVVHLSEKAWGDRRTIRKFILSVCRHHTHLSPFTLD